MAVSIVVGTHWGDEGKGKIVDYLGENAQVVARAQGGNNAGHTVIVEGEKYVFHLLPSGVLHPGKVGILGDGMVVDPSSLLGEIDFLRQKGKDVSERLFLSSKAHLVLPYHRILDGIYENIRGGRKLGTTGKGIGPAYEDKVSRWGIRVGDLEDEKLFAQKLRVTLDYKNLLLERAFNQPPLPYDKILEDYLGYASLLRPYIADTSKMIYQFYREGKNILIEGAQGTMLDLDHGTYPFVTSSYPVAAGSLLGVGLGLGSISNLEVLGVCKAYTTRVGEGPFPTELREEMGDYLRDKGGEYGATTGRPRRCGWLDGVILRYAARINGITSLALTKLDVLGGIDSLKVCRAYLVEGEEVDDFPVSSHLWDKCEPVYEEMEGWEEDISSVSSYYDLPSSAQRFVEFIEDFMQIPIAIVSVGKERRNTLVRKEIF
ncbi:MAG TPA: adenylosuccinate synthase [Candidatus Atribacteria bacterium]|jgi:adenylosuccinate synthase|nr:adenylosuccinate synthase [Candidatus Atribacteria bacterium]HPZ40149.1 adenylosuccinate synthase [Candidatus Atribacteria bacterium]HQD33103.1 adenylosuccinate synthase [Candidatus Atribacteria bacterium]